jgi:hypothetical protein
VETHQQQLVLTSSVEAIHVFMGRNEKRKKTREMTRPGLLREEKDDLFRTVERRKKREMTCLRLLKEEKRQKKLSV